jgi:glycosyltransferase involved in cell wall biosynthesis
LSRNFIRARSKLVAADSYDIVYSHYIRSFGHDDFDANGARKVIGMQLSHQAHFAKAALQASNALLRYLYATERKRLGHWEGRIAAMNDLVHLISRKDLELIEGWQQWAGKVFFNPHGVDGGHFVPDLAREVPGRVVFTGNLGFQANEDAICWFCSQIWPRIAEGSPAATLLVAGSRPTDKVVRAVGASVRASLVANPAEMRDVIQTGQVCIDPLRVGAGLQNKILEALACGIATVSTTLGNEGIGARAGSEILLADSPEEFSGQVLRLLSDPDLRAEVGASGRRLIEREWSWEHHFGLMEERWKQLVGDRSI